MRGIFSAAPGKNARGSSRWRGTSLRSFLQSFFLSMGQFQDSSPIPQTDDKQGVKHAFLYLQRSVHDSSTYDRAYECFQVFESVVFDG